MRILKKLSLCSLALATCLSFILSGSVFAMSHDHDKTDQTVTDTNNENHDGDHSKDKQANDQDTHDTDHDTDHSADHSYGGKPY